ncbi:MAG: hypothetical protein ACPGED_11170, partial [Flavobacteriales bacterium]
TFYNTKKHKLLAYGASNIGDMKTMGSRPMQVIIFDGGMIFINVHVGHYNASKAGQMITDINDAFTKILNSQGIQQRVQNVKDVFSKSRLVMAGDFNYDLKTLKNPLEIKYQDVTRKIYYNDKDLETCCNTAYLLNATRSTHVDHVLDSFGAPTDIDTVIHVFPASDHAPVLAKLLMKPSERTEDVSSQNLKKVLQDQQKGILKNKDEVPLIDEDGLKKFEGAEKKPEVEKQKIIEKRLLEKEEADLKNKAKVAEERAKKLQEQRKNNEKEAEERKKRARKRQQEEQERQRKLLKLQHDKELREFKEKFPGLVKRDDVKWKQLQARQGEEKRKLAKIQQERANDLNRKLFKSVVPRKAEIEAQQRRVAADKRNIMNELAKKRKALAQVGAPAAKARAYANKPGFLDRLFGAVAAPGKALGAPDRREGLNNQRV